LSLAPVTTSGDLNALYLLDALSPPASSMTALELIPLLFVRDDEYLAREGISGLSLSSLSSSSYF